MATGARPGIEAGTGPLSRLARTFDRSTLRGHFALGRALPRIPDGWLRQSLDGWHLACAPDLPVLEVVDGSGVGTGWVLGHPLVPGQGPVEPPLRVPAAIADPDFADAFERLLYFHAGQYAGVLLGPSPRVYVDAFGSLPVLYDPTLELVSSSPFLLTEDEDVPDSILFETLEMERIGRWFILGTTAHARAERLLPNHLLDLRSWAPRRHWPPSEIEPGNVDELVDQVADAIEGAVVAAAARERPNVSITAGADSRCILACSRAHLERLRYFTVAFSDGLGDTDVRGAPGVAALCDLDHRVLPWIPATQADIDRFLYQTGWCIGELRGKRAGPTYAQLGGSGPYVCGVGSIISKNWRKLRLTRDGRGHSPTDAGFLLRYFWFPELPELVERADRWLEEAPRLDPFNVRLLYHLEMRYGCWGGALAMGYPEACSYTLYPFGQRVIADAVLRLPLDYRLAGTLRHDIVLRRWPELHDLPVNRPTFRVATTRRLSRTSGLAAGARRRLVRIGRRLLTRGRDTTS